MFKIFRHLLLIALAMIQFPAFAALPTILVMGDSLSAGFGLARQQAWPSLLEQKLKQEKRDYAVANASISGETTSGGLSRLPAALKQFQPAVVIVALGANDGLRGLPVATMKSNLDAMIRQSQAAGAKVLLIGMHLPPNFGPDYTTAFDRAFADLAKQYKLPFLPFLLEGFAERPEMFQPDGLHPVAAAEPIILAHVWPELKKLLK